MAAEEVKHCPVSFGRIAYREAGEAGRPTVLLVHGIPTSSYLWRDVMAELSGDFHCLAPDLMGLGHTQVDPRTTPLHMDAQAEMLMEFMQALGHESYSVICHDQGGAPVQIMVDRCPERLTALVLTDCVCYDNWPVPAIARLQKLFRPPVVTDWLGRIGAYYWLEARTPLSAFKRGVHDRSKMTNRSIAEYLRPLQNSTQGRARFRKFLLAGHPRYTMQAVEGLKRFDKPTLVIWAADDYYISPSWGKKLAEEIPGVKRFVLVPFAGHFWQEERAPEFSSHMLAFLKQHLPAGG